MFDKKILRNLLEQRSCSLDFKNSELLYTLQFSTDEEQCKNITEILLDRGANINTKGPSGDTPLHLAVTRGHVEVVELLLKRGASVNIKNGYGETALSIAAYNARGFFISPEHSFQYRRIVKILLNHGANIREIAFRRGHYIPLSHMPKVMLIQLIESMKFGIFLSVFGFIYLVIMKLIKIYL